MGSVTKSFNFLKSMGKMCKLLNSVGISGESSTLVLRRCSPLLINQSCIIHSTLVRRDFMEFFDDKENWGQNEVKVGRAWRKDELRIKSNSDLHKLWFVLLKEKNMLLTMEHECKEKMELFPNPERLDKVEESMENLENVVRERNKAYHLLETGETGERPGTYVSSPLGTRYFYRGSEHLVPRKVNKKYCKQRKFGFGGYAVRKFLRHYREKLYNEKRKARNRDRNHVIKLLRRFPEQDLGVLKNKYPHVDVDKLLRDDKCRGHFVPKI